MSRRILARRSGDATSSGPPPGNLGPIVVLGAPGAGDGVVVQALENAAGIVTPRAGTPPLPEVLERFRLGRQGSHRLDATDARPRGVARDVDRALRASLDAADAGPASAAGRPLLSGLRLALRVPFLAAALPDARFVLVHRELRTAVAFALDGWRSGTVVSAPDLPGWNGPPWSLPVVPGWRELSGLSLGDLVGRQWAQIAEIALADLSALDPSRWTVLDREALLAAPRDELQRLCGFLELPYDQALLSPVEAARRSTARRGPVVGTPELEAALATARPADARIRERIAAASFPAPVPAPARQPTAEAASPGVTHGSRASGSLGTVLERLGGSLLLASEQASTLVGLSVRDGRPSTHFHRLEQPTALAVGDRRFAVATRTEIWDFRETADSVSSDGPGGRRDARYLPRQRHLIGPAGVEDLAFVGDELWIVSSALSCLATLDPQHGLRARWTVPAPASQPHERTGRPSGLAVRDEQVAFVSAFDAEELIPTDEAGGVVFDVRSGEIVLRGLARPHSPRWHRDRLWLLEGGRGTLAVADPESGDVETILELPGYARGLQIVGEIAFVGLSQHRRPGRVADLPLTRRLSDRRSGVWAVDLRSGTVAGFLRFEDAVQEIQAVGVLPRRWPELIDDPRRAAADALPGPRRR